MRLTTLMASWLSILIVGIGVGSAQAKELTAPQIVRMTLKAGLGSRALPLSGPTEASLIEDAFAIRGSCPRGSREPYSGWRDNTRSITRWGCDGSRVTIKHRSRPLMYKDRMIRLANRIARSVGVKREDHGEPWVVQAKRSWVTVAFYRPKNAEGSYVKRIVIRPGRPVTLVLEPLPL